MKIFEVEIEARYTVLVCANSCQEALSISKGKETEVMNDDPYPETYHSAVEIGRDAWDKLGCEAMYGEFSDVKELLAHLEETDEEAPVRCPLTLDMFGDQLL